MRDDKAGDRQRDGAIAMLQAGSVTLLRANDWTVTRREPGAIYLVKIDGDGARACAWIDCHGFIEYGWPAPPLADFTTDETIAQIPGAPDGI